MDERGIIGEDRVMPINQHFRSRLHDVEVEHMQSYDKTLLPMTHDGKSAQRKRCCYDLVPIIKTPKFLIMSRTSLFYSIWETFIITIALY